MVIVAEIIMLIISLILVDCGVYMFLHGCDKIEKSYGLFLSATFASIIIWYIVSRLLWLGSNYYELE